MVHMTETSALFTAASVAVVTWIALFGYLVKIDTALRRLEGRK
ncbi:MAG: CcmD family protein [Bacillota bacterium]|jgi:CcmD family protein